MMSTLVIIKTYIFRVAASMSQFGNAALLGGWPDETISGRMHRENHHIAKEIINTIFFFQEDHCRQSHLEDVEFSKMILEDERTENGKDKCP